VTRVRSRAGVKTPREQREYIETRIRGDGPSTVRSDAFETNGPQATTDVEPPEEPRVEPTVRRTTRRPGFWEKHGHQLLVGGAITVALGALGWLFVTVIGMNREVGEVKTGQAALEEKLQDTKVSIGALNQEHTRQLGGLEGRLDRLDGRVDALAASGSAQSHLRAGTVPSPVSQAPR
jgi:hypothetical protein